MDKILEFIELQDTISYNQSFDLALKCSRLIASGTEEELVMARKIIIRVLDELKKIPKETYDIWSDLVEAVGFYPYLEKNKKILEQNSLADEIRIQSYKSDYLDNKYMHIKQKELFDLLKSEVNVVASAPTSFGKSLLIEEIVASGIYNNIIIIQPTLALLDETRIKLRKYKDRYKTIVRTSQAYSVDKGNLFLLTAERVMEYEEFPHIDLLIIDEFYKLSLRRKDERANILNNAFLRIVNKYNSKFYLLGPNIDGITEGFADKYNAVFFKSSYSLVDCDVIDKSKQLGRELSKAKYENRKIELLCELLYELKNEQTIIYFSSPARARKYAKIYCNYLAERESEKKEELPLVAWLEENVSKRWGLVNELKNEIAIHDGSLQKHIGAAIIDYFNDGKLKYIFCTSTIIEGVNTSAKNVVIFDEKKGTNELDFFDYSNIKGRSGRMMEHYVGKVYNFINIPKEEKIVVDIPFYEQNKDLITDEILVNIPEKDVKPQVRERYDKIYEISSELLDIIKKNGTSVNGQMSIYYALERDIQNGHYNDISWTRMPEYNKMLYILKLAENNTFTCENNKGILSVKQLTMYLNLYRANGNMMQIIESLYNYKKSKVKNLTAERDSNYYDQAIEEAFHIYRHWFQFTVPKAFRVVDSLQRYVCEKHGKKAGSYSYFVQQLENDFLQENLSILLEYGLPRSLVQKMTKFLPENLSEDEVLNYIIKNKSSIIKILTPYEQERLIACIL